MAKECQKFKEFIFNILCPKHNRKFMKEVRIIFHVVNCSVQASTDIQQFHNFMNETTLLKCEL